MSVLITFIKLISVFDLLVIAVYFGGDILSTMLNKLRITPQPVSYTHLLRGGVISSIILTARFIFSCLF